MIGKKIASLFIAILLLSAPYLFGYGYENQFLSDLISGLIVLFFGLLWIFNVTDKARWVLALTGVWLQLAPLVFWAENPVIYTVDTVAGVLLLLVAFVIPDTPSSNEDAIPLGWSYNPSAWSQRVIILLCATICATCARYLGAFELGYIDTLWEPLFGDGTYKVLTSSISKSFPVADAALGAFAYTMDIILACHGDGKRWIRSPWIVVAFACLVVPLGIVSIVLMILQPVVLHVWCTLCLVVVFFMLVLVAFTIDELIPVIQLLYKVRQEKKSVWKVLWEGADPLKYAKVKKEEKIVFSSFFNGVSFSWTLFLSVLLSVWLSASPQFFGFEGPLAIMYHLAGALGLTFSMLALAEPLRLVRYLNLVVALSVFIASFLLAPPTLVIYNGLITGIHIT